MKKRKYKRLIQIKTNKGGWKTVEFLKYLPNNRMLIKLPSGEVISRKNKRVRMCIQKRLKQTLKR